MKSRAVRFLKPLFWVQVLAASFVFSCLEAAKAAHGGEETVAVERKERPVVTNFVPLRLSYSFFYNAFGLRHETLMLSRDGRVYENAKRLHPADGGCRVLTPSAKDWKAFFEACEYADLWDLAERENRFLPQEYYYEYTAASMFNNRWHLVLEYPGRKLDVGGQETILRPEILEAAGLGENRRYASENVMKVKLYGIDVDVYVLPRFSGCGCVYEGCDSLISNNLDIASKYPELASVWKAMRMYVQGEDR